MKHFGIFDNAEDLQDALNAGTIENVYVALVDGSLDYNSLSPEEPCYLGEWSDNGAGHYTFQILDTGDTAWVGGVNIGSLADVYFNGDGPIDMDVTLSFGGTYWSMTFVEPEESASPSYTFDAGTSDTWDCTEVMTDGDSSTASVHVGWDGVDTFEFYQMAEDAPDLSMNTINPECSEDEPEPEPTCEDECEGDPECECTCQGPDYWWDAETQTCQQYADPCAGYGSQEECDCAQQGGVWNGEECEMPEPDESE